jgi:hypothetical protein
MLNCDIHLPASHFMNSVSHRNWRERANWDVELGKNESLHYTSVFAISRGDAEILRSFILKVIEKSRSIIKPSPSEEVYCMLCDFFEV